MPGRDEGGTPAAGAGRDQAAGRLAASRGGARRYVPILEWLPSYDRSWLSADVLAGLTLWGLLVPEAMAYAGIAGNV
jgi:hypothetical protein